MSSPKHERTGPDGVGAVPYLPLSSDTDVPGDQSIGRLVGDATQHISTLVRAEMELAKSELVGEVKKGLKGAIYFLIALTVLLYSSFFFFFALSEGLADWFHGLHRWGAFLVVLGLMWVVTAVAGFLGYRKVKKFKAPERTIASVKETASALKPHKAADADLTTTRD
ncbi:Putative Holin-X, holin superfamily III [Amycolatopsis pretoriensis]|uniref:Putative Holin-X, holin superfamily III n=1 Tax=Amycolatopsis pretoriensis TaxID=218821 RepID=A0A1H5QTG8_9PSEU|nr:phage holin family protein [Amycolatopsis pretoriensis]SEF29134.1 Putative Holin-X, holin superfamily III [Amycolatopsis pretoriensis]